MSKGDSAPYLQRQINYDLMIVGGGILGLWLALKAGRQNMQTLLIEKQHIGAGASGGLLGALMPHMPERWDGKKQFQFEALQDLPVEINRIEEETSLSCGYHQCGRIAPIMNATKRGQMLDYSQGVDEFWLGYHQWQVLDKTPIPNWPEPSKATHGVVFDSLSARVNPRKLLSGLKAAISLHDNVTIMENTEFEAIDHKAQKAKIFGQGNVGFSHIAITAGVDTFPIISPMLNITTSALGKPIKGQAAMLKADIDPTRPIVFDDGVYVIAHEGGHVAIGSTSEIEFEHPFTNDEKINVMIKKARSLCPELEHAPIVEKWAGLRPRAIGRDPMIDLMPDHDKIIVSTSGFKITFGIAHKMADVALELIQGQRVTNTPDSFSINAHLAKARRAEKNNTI